MSAFTNGEVVRIGFESDTPTPLNQELVESLSSVFHVSSQKAAPGAGSAQKAEAAQSRSRLLVTSPLPHLLSYTDVAVASSMLIGAVAVAIPALAFMFRVVLFW